LDLDRDRGLLLRLALGVLRAFSSLRRIMLRLSDEMWVDEQHAVEMVDLVLQKQVASRPSQSISFVWLWRSR